MKSSAIYGVPLIGALIGCLCLGAVASAQENDVKKEGPTITIASARESYKAGERLDLTVEFRNATDETVYLFDPYFISGQLTLDIEDSETGKRYQGLVHGDPLARRMRTIHALAAGKTMRVPFSGFPLDRLPGNLVEFRSDGESKSQLPSGTYRIRADFTVEPDVARSFAGFSVWVGTIRSKKITIKVDVKKAVTAHASPPNQSLHPTGMGGRDSFVKSTSLAPMLAGEFGR